MGYLIDVIEPHVLDDGILQTTLVFASVVQLNSVLVEDSPFASAFGVLIFLMNIFDCLTVI